MNDQVLQTIHSYFDALLPHDPLGLKEYLLPWWNQELFEEYGFKVPTGLLQNRQALENPEEAFRFFSERTKCRIEESEYGPVVMFEEGSFRPGEDFALNLPRLKIFGCLRDGNVFLFKNDDKISSEMFTHVDISDPKVLENTEISFSRLVLRHGQPVLFNPDEPAFPGNGNGYITLLRNFNSQDRSLAIEEVKKSILWRALN